MYCSLTVAEGTNTSDTADEDDRVSRDIRQPDRLVLDIVDNLSRVEALTSNSKELSQDKRISK